MLEYALKKSGFYKNLLWGIMITILLLFNLYTLQTYPKPDSLKYWDTDESWSINWAKNAVTEGRSFLERAAGSYVENKYSFKLGEYWIYNLTYGIPLLIFNDFSVEAARVVSFIVGLIILLISYHLTFRFTKNKDLSFLTVMIILPAQSFIFGTHCARYDILTSLYITLSLFFLLHIDKLINKSKSLFFILGLYAGGSIFVSLHSVAFLGPLSFAIYLFFIKKKEFSFFISPANFLFLAGLIIPLIVNVILSISGIGNKPLLFFPQAQSNFNVDKAAIYNGVTPFEFLLKTRYKFFNFFEENIYLLILLISLVALLSLSKIIFTKLWQSIPSGKEKRNALFLISVWGIMFIIYFIIIPLVWGVYTVFLLPLTAITLVYFLWLINNKTDPAPEGMSEGTTLKNTQTRITYLYWNKISSYSLIVGFIIFILSLNSFIGVLNNKYDKEGLQNAVIGFEKFIKENEADSVYNIFADFHLSNYIINKKEIKYYTNFPDDRRKNYYNILDSVIAEKNINYIIDIATVHQVLYKRQYPQISSLLSEYLELEIIKEETGIFDDLERDYDLNESWKIPDTLRLYRIVKHK